MKDFILTILKRFSQPSSFAGLSIILTNIGIHLPNGSSESVSYILAGIAGGLAIILNEKSGK